MFAEGDELDGKVEDVVTVLPLDHLANDRLIPEDYLQDLYHLITSLPRFTFLLQGRNDVHQHIQTRPSIRQLIQQITGKLNTLFQFLIPRITAIPLIGFTEDALDAVDHPEEIIIPAADLSLRLLLHHLAVDDLEREVQVVHDVVLNNKVECHILIHLTDLFSYPRMQCTDRVALQILRLDLTDRQINVLHRPTLVLLLFLHLLLWDLETDDEVWSLRGEDLVDVLKIEIFFGGRIPLKTEHQFSLLLN